MRTSDALPPGSEPFGPQGVPPSAGVPARRRVAASELAAFRSSDPVGRTLGSGPNAEDPLSAEAVAWSPRMDGLFDGGGRYGRSVDSDRHESRAKALPKGSVVRSGHSSSFDVAARRRLHAGSKSGSICRGRDSDFEALAGRSDRIPPPGIVEERKVAA